MEQLNPLAVVRRIDPRHRDQGQVEGATIWHDVVRFCMAHGELVGLGE
jgi:hypothetical protein